MSERSEPEKVIDCIDCGGPCYLTSTWPPDDPPQPGDVMVYRCRDCLDAWHLVIPEDEVR